MTSQNAITEIFESFQYIKVLIVGDVMVDEYLMGNVHRISPEAPVPVVDVHKKERRLGGAANVALNIASLGGTALLASVVGDDEAGHDFQRKLRQNNINSSNLILDQERITTVKSRVISRNNHMLRFDYEQKDDIDDKIELLLLDNIIDTLYTEKPHAVVLQDYNKGVLTPTVISNIISTCQELSIPIAVDPKKKNFFAYEGCTLFKPNLKEAVEGLHLPIDPTKAGTLLEADQVLRSKLQHEYSIITLSEKGVFVGTQDDHEIIPAYYRKIVDVSGAGDTVISMLTLGLALGLDIFATAELANIAAGLVCEQVGVVPINRELLLKEALAFMG